MSDKALATLEYALETGDFGDEEVKAAAELICFNIEEWKSIKDQFSKDFIKKAAGVAKKMKAERNKELTEMGLAESFINQNRGNIRFCDNFQHGWMIYENRQWSEDKTERIKSKIRDHIKSISHGDAKLEKASVLGSVEKLIRIEQKIRTVADDWDSSPLLLGTPAGVIDLRSGELMESHKEILISKRSSVSPSNDARCEKWMGFLDDITASDVEYQIYLQKMVGYFLTGLTIEQAIFFGFGCGGNGKSIFANVVDLLLGDYFGAAPFSTFVASKVQSHPTDLAGFVGRRCVVATETKENRSWNTDLIKALSGSDKISARFMRGDFFDYTPSFKLMVLGNHMPNLESVDHSTKRRFHILPFLFDPVQNKHRINPRLLDDLKAELPAIMRWAIDGCLLWQKEGLKKPDKVKALTDSYFESEDIFSEFLLHLQNTKHYEQDQRIKSADLFSAYRDYLDRNGEEPSSNKRMSQQLAKAGLSKGRDKQGIFFVWNVIYE